MEDKLIKLAFKELKKSHHQGDTCPDECDFCQFLEGGMDEERKSFMEKHLLSCPACTDYMVSLNKVIHFPAEEGLPEVPGAQIEKSCDLMEGKKKSVREETGLLQAVREFFSFNWIIQPIPVMVKSCAAALAVVLIFSTAYLYVQQSTPLSAQLEVTGMSSVVTRGRAPETERIIKEGDILYSQGSCRVRFELSRDAFAYVFYYDSGGELHQLYPDPAAAAPQKVKGGKTYSIPENEVEHFILDDQRGTETIFMVASAKPMENISELYQTAKGLNRDDALEVFRNAAPVFKVLTFMHR